MSFRQENITTIEETTKRTLLAPHNISTFDLQLIVDMISDHEKEMEYLEEDKLCLEDKVSELEGQVSEQQDDIDLSADTEVKLLKALDIIEELTDWMRDHTRPADGTHEMLTKAVDFLLDERVST